MNPPGANERNLRQILLAEDDPTNQFVFRTILEAAGYQIEMVENGRLALEVAAIRPPALFLLDMMMPEVDGYEVARRVSSNPQFDGIPIIALTANAMRGDLEKTLDAGCDGYMAKPISRKALLGMVDFWLHRPAVDWMPDRILRRQDGKDRRSA